MIKCISYESRKKKKKIEERYFYASCKDVTHSSCKFQGIILVTVKVYIYLH